MAINEKAIIALSKTKLIKLFIAALAFVAAGVLFSFKPFWFTKSDNPDVVIMIGYGTMIFFGLCAVYIGTKIFDKKPGLILDEEGITDNSGGAASRQKILWKDVKDISLQQVMSETFIMLKMKNPDFYYKEEKNPVKKRMMELNYRLYGTPVSISANGLKIEAEALYELIRNHFLSHK